METPKIRGITQDPAPLQGLGVGTTGVKDQPLQGTTVTRINLFQLCSVILSPQLGSHILRRRCLVGPASGHASSLGWWKGRAGGMVCSPPDCM